MVSDHEKTLLYIRYDPLLALATILLSIKRKLFFFLYERTLKIMRNISLQICDILRSLVLRLVRIRKSGLFSWLFN